MPIYIYVCDEPCERCGGRREEMHAMSAPPLTACPECGKAIRRVVALPLKAIRGGDTLSDARINRSGMTKYVHTGDGKYEKAAGPDEAPKTIDRNRLPGG